MKHISPISTKKYISEAIQDLIKNKGSIIPLNKNVVHTQKKKTLLCAFNPTHWATKSMAVVLTKMKIIFIINILIVVIPKFQNEVFNHTVMACTILCTNKPHNPAFTGTLCSLSLIAAIGLVINLYINMNILKI